MINKEELSKIGVFAKPHGIKGEIELVVERDFPDFEDDDFFLVCEIDGLYIPFFVESCRSKTSTVMLLKFAVVDSDKEARRLSGRDAYMPVAGRIDIPRETTVRSWDSFIGYTLQDGDCNTLGILAEIDSTTINTLLQVDNNGKEILIPAVREWIIEMDDSRKVLRISIPDGLQEI